MFGLLFAVQKVGALQSSGETMSRPAPQRQAKQADLGSDDDDDALMMARDRRNEKVVEARAAGQAAAAAAKAAAESNSRGTVALLQ